MKVLVKSLCKEDLNLPKLLGAALDIAAWPPVGGNKDQCTGSLEEAPSICSSLQPECGLLKTPIWSSHSPALDPSGAAVYFQEKGPKTLARTTCYLYFN